MTIRELHTHLSKLVDKYGDAEVVRRDDVGDGITYARSGMNEIRVARITETPLFASEAPWSERGIHGGDPLLVL